MLACMATSSLLDQFCLYTFCVSMLGQLHDHCQLSNPYTRALREICNQAQIDLTSSSDWIADDVRLRLGAFRGGIIILITIPRLYSERIRWSWSNISMIHSYSAQCVLAKGSQAWLTKLSPAMMPSKYFHSKININDFMKHQANLQRASNASERASTSQAFHAQRFINSKNFRALISNYSPGMASCNSGSLSTPTSGCNGKTPAS